LKNISTQSEAKMDILSKAIEYYENNDYNWRDVRGLMFEDFDYEERINKNYYSSRMEKNDEMHQLRKLAQKLLNKDGIFDDEELGKDDSILFAIIIDALELQHTERNYYSRYGKDEWIKMIYEKYKDDFFRLSKNRKLSKPLLNNYKIKLRKLRHRFDPKNNLNYVKFKNYENPLSMIAFINGHIASGKLTQSKAKKVLEKLLFTNRSYNGSLNYNFSERELPKAQIVFTYIANNLFPYFNISEKNKFLRIILEYMPNYEEIFKSCIKKNPNNYIKTLFGRDIFIKKFGRFDKEMLELFTKGIINHNRAIDELLNYAKTMSKKLINQSMSGGPRKIFDTLPPNPHNYEDDDDIPYFTDIMDNLNDISYNIKAILDKLGYYGDKF